MTLWISILCALRVLNQVSQLRGLCVKTNKRIVPKISDCINGINISTLSFKPLNLDVC